MLAAEDRGGFAFRTVRAPAVSDTNAKGGEKDEPPSANRGKVSKKITLQKICTKRLIFLKAPGNLVRLSKACRCL